MATGVIGEPLPGEKLSPEGLDDHRRGSDRIRRGPEEFGPVLALLRDAFEGRRPAA